MHSILKGLTHSAQGWTAVSRPHGGPTLGNHAADALYPERLPPKLHVLNPTRIARRRECRSAACKKNLEKINAAITAYRKDHKDVPNWLNDLVPKYLSDTNLLVCPVTRRTGHQSPYGVLDPKVYSSYLYEFTPTPVPEVIKGAFPGPEMTMRDWKRQQMQLAGQQVPLVRCMMHDPVLNLSIGGKVYESQMSWELSFTNEAGLKAFYPH